MHSSDKQWLASIKSGRTAEKHDAFEQILFHYEKLIWHITRRYFFRDEDACDAFQEACIKIYNGLPAVTLPENGSLKSWIARVTTNTCLDELRRRKSTAGPIPLPEDNPSAATVDSAEDEALARVRTEEILHAISLLSEEHRTLIILRDMNGLSYQELAEATDTNINTVKSRLSRAREALYKKIHKRL